MASSKRDRIKQLNRKESAVSKAEPKESIIDDQYKEFGRVEEEIAANTPVMTESTEPQSEPESIKNEKSVSKTMEETSSDELINVIDKSHVGRPKVLEGVYKPISARLKMECYEYARKVGGKYGGMNAYINWLIEQDMKKAQ